MSALLIGVIYLAFVSMGLPDSLLGAAWPTLYTQLQVPVSYAGILTVLISAGTVISSLLCDRMLRRFGTGKLAVGCTALVAIALFGFSCSNAFWQLCLWALPYGLGAGSIDAALNNHVALHCGSRQMNWIHFFWGVGATAGPYILGALLTGGQTWNAGYRAVGGVQTAMAVCLFFTLPLWKREGTTAQSARKAPKISLAQAVRYPGAVLVLGAFLCYDALEATAGLWASSFMVLNRGIAAATAAKWTSLYYLGITAGRFLSGLIADRIGDKNMIRAGLGLALTGIALMLLPLPDAACFAGLTLIGLGCAPVFPCLLHETPVNFGADKSQAFMGIQMACAYTGTTLMPPLLGVLAERFGIALYPGYLLLFALLVLLMLERVNWIARNNRA